MMPVHVERREGKKPYKVVENNIGHVVGSSTTKANAQHSANARNAARQGWKPTGKKGR
jgi:hypothetical protein